ncbi:hypothetical protein GLAREA_00933 [Glarea lozoyensis ATCC 20868]|nr:uncharacterized protein GLAREA_00933 [Glarea lozoyensis ATCC 20868]EPE29773.1 hypothetical protein GLAREA_00933 [Glarea lozoyensis ATCC 20868]
MSSHLTSKLFTRDLSPESNISLIVGIFTIVTGVLSVLLSWAVWKLAYERRQSSEVGEGG